MVRTGQRRFAPRWNVFGLSVPADPDEPSRKRRRSPAESVHGPRPRNPSSEPIPGQPASAHDSSCWEPPAPLAAYLAAVCGHRRGARSPQSEPSRRAGPPRYHQTGQWCSSHHPIRTPPSPLPRSHRGHQPTERKPAAPRELHSHHCKNCYPQPKHTPTQLYLHRDCPLRTPPYCLRFGV